MISRNRAAAGIASVVLVAVIAIGGYVLVARPGTDATPTPTVEPPLPDAAACPIPAGTGEIRLAESTGGQDPNAGLGVVAICDRAGRLLGTSAQLVCGWSADRKHVRSLDVAIGEDPTTIGATIHVERQRPPILTFFLGGHAFRSDDPRLVGGTDAAAPSGVIGFRDVPAAPGPTAGAALDPTLAGGIIRWACGPAPQAVAGESAGTVRLDIDGMPNAERFAEATCRWLDVDGTMIVSALETRSDALQIGGRDSGVVIGRDDVTALDPPRVEIYVSDPQRGGVAFSGEFVWPLTVDANAAAGVFRFRGFQPDAAGAASGLPEITSGQIGWTCEPTAVPASPAPSTEPSVARPTRIGTGSIELGGPIGETVPATVTCAIQEADPANTDGPTTPQIESVELSGTWQNERFVLTSRFGGVFVLERISAGGQVLGEYVSGELGGWGPQEADLGPHHVSIGSMKFEPTDPRYVPLGGLGGPASLTVAVNVDCRR